MESLLKQLEKAKAESPEDSKKFESLIREISNVTAFTFQPLVLPYLEIKPL
jgi:hypothetical protein